MRYFLRHITQMPLPAALMLLAGALAMWTVDYVRMPEAWLTLLGTQVLALGCAILLCVVLYRAKAAGRFTLLPAVLYVFAVAVFPYLREHWQPQLIALIMLLFLLHTCNMNEAREPNGLVFLMTILLCLTALIGEPDALWCIPLLWGVILLQGGFTFRCTLASLLAVALVAVYYVLAMYVGVADEWDLTSLLNRHWMGGMLPHGITVSIGVMLGGFATISVAVFQRSSYDLVSTRMLFYHLFLCGLLAAPFVLFATQASGLMVMLPFTLSALTSLFLLQKQSEVRGVTLLLYMVATLALYLWLVLSL